MSTIVKRHIDLERAQNRRTQVRDAAAICFAGSGFHGANMAKILKQAGMRAGPIDNYFDNKDAIIMAFVAMCMEHGNDKLLNVSQQANPLEYMVEEIVDEQLDTAMWGMALEMSTKASRNPVFAAALRAVGKDARIRLHALIKQGREQRALAANAHTVEGRTSAMIAMFNDLPLRTLHDPGLDRANLTEACRVAMRALLLT